MYGTVLPLSVRPEIMGLIADAVRLPDKRAENTETKRSREGNITSRAIYYQITVHTKGL